MSVSTTSTNSANLYLYYVKKLLSVLQPRLALYPLGKKTSLPKGFGTQVKWLRYSRISSSTSTLTEGTAPSEISFTTQNVTATIAQYGQFAKVSDLLEMTAIDPVIDSLSELFGEAAAETIEDLIVAELDAHGSVQYANGRSALNSILSTDVIVMKEFIKAMINLKINKVPPHEMGKFMAVLHPAAEYDIMAETNVGGWLDVNSYVGIDKENIVRGEFGSLYGIRFLTSDKMTSADNSGSVHCRNNYLIGREAFGVVELDGKNVQMLIKDRKSGGVANPLEQYSTVGYKLGGFVAKYLGGSGNGTADRVTIIKSATTL